ncbi:NUDIX hydrolase [Planococcus sp. YIM B11945]|uniref:NUDIX hydrolase n=1 Tax=Planococcus sp. YIM B11945 TaxID=3435410 RepID=UPI003D7C3778
MRDRGSAVLIKDKRVVLIKRVREESTYYVFPGGGIEPGETPEQAAEREAYEELGVEILAKECLAIVQHNGTQFFFLAELLSGDIGVGIGEEFTDPERNRGTYEPLWVAFEQLPWLDVKPREVAEKVHALYG